MVAKFLVIPVFIIKCDKKILDALFRPFTKKLLQSLTKEETLPTIVVIIFSEFLLF